jgi:linoleoyl-CoA desaturase
VTVIQKKKTDSQIAHLTPEDIEMLGIELDAIRQSVIDTRGERDAKYIRKVIKTQRSLELGSRAVLLFSIFPPAWLVGTAGLSIAKILDNMEIGHNILHGQWDWMRDPKIHSTTWEWDHATPAEQWKVSHNELHHNFTNVVGKDNDLGYGIMRVDEDQPWQPFYVVQPLWNVPGAGKEGHHQGPPPDDQGLCRAPDPVGPLGPAHPGRELHREHRPQRLGALHHHVRPLPRGRRDLRADLDRGRDPR